jgi:hypothetical protein
LLQILLVAALDIKTPDVPTVSSINSLLSQYCKAWYFFANFYVGGGGGANCSLCPGCPMGKDRPCLCVFTDEQKTKMAPTKIMKEKKVF